MSQVLAGAVQRTGNFTSIFRDGSYAQVIIEDQVEFKPDRRSRHEAPLSEHPFITISESFELNIKQVCSLNCQRVLANRTLIVSILSRRRSVKNGRG